MLSTRLNRELQRDVGAAGATNLNQVARDNAPGSLTSTELGVPSGLQRDNQSSHAGRADASIEDDVVVAHDAGGSDDITSRVGIVDDGSELNHSRSDRVRRVVILSGIARIGSATSNNHRARTLDLVEDRLKPFRMLRFHGQLEVGNELTFVTTAVVDRFTGAICAQVVGRELPATTVIPNQERHIRVHGLGAATRATHAGC